MVNPVPSNKMIKEKEVSVFVQKEKYAKRYSEALGREVKKQETISLPPQLLSPQSHRKITAICDCCGEVKEMEYRVYYKITRGLTTSYECAKHNTERLKSFSLQTYGTSNPFQAEEVKAKSRATCVEKYGVPYNTQRQEHKEKYLLGKNNYFYKGGSLDKFYDNNAQLKKWRYQVYRKGNYRCAICGKGKQTGDKINAHHLWGYFDFPDKIYDVENGVVLCLAHHMRFHWQYQDQVITPQLFDEFVKGQTTIPTGSTAEDELPLEVLCNPLG